MGNLVGWIFPFPNIIWRVSLVLLSLYVILFEEGKRLPCEKTIFFFTIFNLLHFFISFIWRDPSTYLIGNILVALLSLSLFVCLSEKGVMNDKFISVSGVILLIVSILFFNYSEQVTIVTHDLDIEQGVTNNASMLFLMLLPMLFLMKNNIQKWASLIICIFFIILGAKRGNIIAAIIPVILFLFVNIKGTRRSFGRTVIVLTLIVGIGYISYRWVANNDYLISRIEQTEEGDSSGRDVLYSEAWQIWSESGDVGVYMFGYGFQGTTDYLYRNKLAHNDWLEVLFDYGLIGIILYLVFLIQFAIQINRVRASELKMVLLSSFFIWILKSVYSMAFMDEALSLMMISMGTALGKYKMERMIV